MQRSVILSKPNVAYIFLFNFCEQKFVQHGPITIAIDCNGHSLLIFEEKWLYSLTGPKSTTNSDLFWVRWLFNVCVRIFVPQMWQILVLYIPAKIKMSLPKRKRIGWSIGSNSWTKVFMHNSSQRCLRVDVDGTSRTYSATAAYSRVYALLLAFHALVFRLRCQFLSLFSQVTNMRASFLSKSVRNFHTHSATLSWISK